VAQTLTVAALHVYFVEIGDDEVLVHNLFRAIGTGQYSVGVSENLGPKK
jgi:hypothetical protein